jgi:hypothetical protein
MRTWQDPGDPNPQQPPPAGDDEQPNPFERPPFDRDPEAQHAPGDEGPDPDTKQPPMQASSAGAGAAMNAGQGEEIVHDAIGAAREPVGNDNIRDGTVGGVMGSPHASNGQGQGG